jgi:prevent-host-death family protein
MKVTFSEVRTQLAEILNRARYTGERFVVTRNGKEIAGVVPLRDLRSLELLEERGLGQEEV